MPEAAAAAAHAVATGLLLCGLAATFLPPRRATAGALLFALLVAASPSGLLLLGSRSDASALGLGLALPLVGLAPSLWVAMAAFGGRGTGALRAGWGRVDPAARPCPARSSRPGRPGRGRPAQARSSSRRPASRSSRSRGTDRSEARGWTTRRRRFSSRSPAVPAGGLRGSGARRLGARPPARPRRGSPRPGVEPASGRPVSVREGSGRRSRRSFRRSRSEGRCRFRR